LTVDVGTVTTAGDGVTGTFTTFTRVDDSSTQVAYDGHPLYYYSGDSAAGDTHGQGIGGVWFVANVAGTVPTLAPASVEASAAPTAAESAAPTEAATAAPTEAATAAPTAAPTEAATAAPTEAPTAAPTEAPTAAPTEAPTAAPTEAATAAPTEAPSAAPSAAPTAAPTEAPSPAPSAAESAAPSAPASAAAGVTIAAATGPLGTYLTGPDGKTLYYFTEDTSGDATVCTDPECKGTWPPLTVDAGTTVTGGEGVTGTFTTFVRTDDGTTQVSYDGHPLYYFAGDSAAGDTNGQGIGGVWFVADVTGAIPSPTPAAASTEPSGAPSAEPSAAESEAAGESYTINTATGTVGTFLTGEDGKTLYVFANDTTANQSTCTQDACVENWPPFTIDAHETVIGGDGVTGTIATFARPDGELQVSYNGAPLYYYAGDSAAGDTNGQGIGGVWSVATPDSATPSSSAAPMTPAPATPGSSSSYNY
jgi:predicted lipoprotein with Yx(FWY)xxD motif